MPDERNAFKVGLVLVIMLLLFVGVVIFIPGKYAPKNPVPIVMKFPQTWPLPLLNKDSLVVVGGQTKGWVTDIQVLGEQLKVFVVVSAELDGSVELRKNAKARAEGPPLGGAGQIVLDVGDDPVRLTPEEGRPLQIEAEFPGGLGAIAQRVNETVTVELNPADPHSLLSRIKVQLDDTRSTSLMAKLQRSMDDLNAATGAVRSQLDVRERDALVGKLNVIMDHFVAVAASLRREIDASTPGTLLGLVHQALDSLNTGMSAVSGLILDTRAPLTQTVQSVANTAAALDQKIIPSIAAQVDPQNASALICRLNMAAGQLNAIMKNVEEISRVGRDVAVLNRDNINETIRNFRQTSQQINTSIKFVLRRPWLIFNKPKEEESRQQEVLEASREYADAAARLDSALGQLKALAELRGGTVRTDDAEFARIRESLRESFSRFQQAESALWKNLDIK